MLDKNTDDSGFPAGSITFTDHITVDWELVADPPDDARLAIVNESNESFLRAVSAIGEFPGEASEEDDSISQEITRLDLKMNLLLDLVSQLIYKQLEIPEKTRVTVSSSHLEWQSSKLPSPGETVYVQAYIQHGTPKPLCFYGEVVSCREGSDVGCVKVRYLGLSGSAQSWLDKLIFRHHRRQIAYSRSKNTADEG